jgi:hypothetical protein
MPRFKLTTKYADHIIVQELASLDGDIENPMTREVFDLRDEQMRVALIKLGWTPPDSERN